MPAIAPVGSFPVSAEASSRQGVGTNYTIYKFYGIPLYQPKIDQRTWQKVANAFVPSVTAKTLTS